MKGYKGHSKERIRIVTWVRNPGVLVRHVKGEISSPIITIETVTN